MINDFTIISEGKVRLKIPNPTRYLRADGVYEPAWAPIFYNPAQTLNRDISVLTLSTSPELRGHELFMLDAFSGTGVRALRYCKEVPETSIVIANDLSRRAYQLIKDNVTLNDVSDCVLATSADANALMHMLKRLGRSPHYIDIDPFGSPKPYIDAALWAVRNNGFLGITATDTASLSGAKWRAGSRHYDTHLTKFQPSHYLGLRVLLGYVARRAASMDRYVSPLISFVNKHYYRLMLKVMRGAAGADEMIATKIGYMIYSRIEGSWRLHNGLRIGRSETVGCHLGEEIIGPLWIGELGDVSLIDKLRLNLEKSFTYMPTYSIARELLKILGDEVTFRLTYSLVEIARRIKVNIPKVQAVIECLGERGARAVRSHLCSVCISTDAPWELVKECIKITSPKTPS